MSDSYLGVPFINQVTPAFVKEDFTGDGSTTDFTLSVDVPGTNEDNLMVVVENVVQEPSDSYTIALDGNSAPRILRFGAAPDASATIYVIHRGIGSQYYEPTAGSITASHLAAGLRSLTTDTFTGDGSTVAFTLTDAPEGESNVLVTVDGIVQKASTNFNISGTTLTFTSAPDASAEIEVKNFVMKTTVRRVPDGSITNVKLSSTIITQQQNVSAVDRADNVMVYDTSAGVLRKMTVGQMSSPTVVDTFTGDGSTVAFTLSNSNATTNGTFVYINGVCQTPTTAYAISSSTITFTAAPDSADAIVVRY